MTLSDDTCLSVIEKVLNGSLTKDKEQHKEVMHCYFSHVSEKDKIQNGEGQ